MIESTNLALLTPILKARMMRSLSFLAFVAPSSAWTTVLVNRKSAVTGPLFGLDLSGNSWKPDSESMGSTDVGDYFPDVCFLS